MSDSRLVDSLAADITSILVARKQRLYDEIRGYPTPIAACDQQFNYLLAQQARLSEELSRWLRSQAEAPDHADPIGLLSSFVRASSSIDDDAKQALLARLGDGNP